MVLVAFSLLLPMFLKGIFATYSPFNDALIKDPTTATGPPLSSRELDLARRHPDGLQPSPGDPRPPLDRAPRFRNYLSYTFTRWPNNRVPYTIDDGFDDKQRLEIAKAIQHIEDSACVRFQPKTGSDQDFVHIYGDEKESCWADDHYEAKKGQHSVHLHRKFCVYKHVIAHELLHLLGVGHEQQRPDRDRHITVNWTNIHVDHAFNFFRDKWDDGTVPDSLASNCANWRGATADHPRSKFDWSSFFSKCTSGLIRKDFGIGYDYNSIMHYDTNFFAKDPAYMTLIPLDPRVTSLGGQVMTHRDVAKLRAAYQCLGTEYSACGGSLVGDGGVLSGHFDNEGCEWLLTVEDGHRVEITFQDFHLADCSTANLTIYSGFKQLQDPKAFFCGPNQATTVTLPSNSATVDFRKVRGSGDTFRATWKKIKTICCQALSISVNRYSPSFFKLRPYLGIYRYMGELHGAPYYRLQTNYNVWLSRTLPLSSFSLAAWAVGHDLEADAGQVGPKREPKFFLGGNARCPHLLEGVFYKEKKDGAFKAEKQVSIRCRR